MIFWFSVDGIASVLLHCWLMQSFAATTRSNLDGDSRAVCVITVKRCIVLKIATRLTEVAPASLLMIICYLKTRHALIVVAI